jgi:hypothetical protein
MGGLLSFKQRGTIRTMAKHPNIELSRLREIGWALWDPIGLRGVGDGAWQDEGGCADEYDSYLFQVASRLGQGEPAVQLVAYLEEMEIDCMGVGRNDTTLSRAEATVAAIANYLSTLPEGPLKVR